MQDQNVQQIVEQLSMAIQKSETEERIKAKMASWNSRQIKNLGNRYTPDLNIPVEIMDSLHGASVDQQFQNIFYDKVDKFLIAMRHTELSEINALCDAIEKYAIELNFFNITSSDIDVIISTVNAIKDFLTSKIEEYYENPEGKKNFDSKAYRLYEKLGIANEFNDYLTNTTVRVAVSPYIILAGDGGVGKSHLIADYIDNCDSLGQTSLLLLGQQFSAGMDVLAILPTLLGCDITYHELFDIFEAIACTQKSRVLICIDALNEGAGVSYFYAWKQLHPIDLKNIAIKRIFELGYDVEKHGKYDRNCTDRVGLRFQLGRKERIGKKYQWIALYELAAQVCDNYQMTVYDNDIGEPHQEYCKGSFEPDIRNIDPTVLVTPGFDNLHIDIAAFSYDIPNNSYEEWLADFSNTPAFEQCVKLQSGAHQYLLLTGEYDWKEAKRLGFRSYDLPRKDMWHQIRGYVVKNEYAESLICALSGVDFMGRWMPEAQSNSAMYNKEYYWSDAHTFFNNPYYCGLEWVNIDSDHLNCVFPEKVLIPVKQYYSERKGELNSLNSEIASIYWHKPCEEMYTKLQLKYLKGSNSAFVDGAGELVCFESSELIGNDTGFYIRYDKLLEFLKSSSYTLVWTSLCEKRILTPSFGKWDLPPKAIHMSSVYYLKDGKIAKASETLFEDRLYY